MNAMLMDWLLGQKDIRPAIADLRRGRLNAAGKKETSLGKIAALIHLTCLTDGKPTVS
jgi:hypothetical protein